jgi:hypothetical protein
MLVLRFAVETVVEDDHPSFVVAEETVLHPSIVEEETARYPRVVVAVDDEETARRHPNFAAGIVAAVAAGHVAAAMDFQPKAAVGRVAAFAMDTFIFFSFYLCMIYGNF